MIFNSKVNAWSTPPVEVKERLMLFRPDYTFVKKAFGKVLSEVERTDIRESQIGNSMHAGVLATIMMPPLKRWCYIPDYVEPAMLGTASKRLVGTDQSSPATRLIRAYLSYQDHRGDLILQEAGQTRVARRPLAESFNAKQWKWRAVISCRWALQHEHINALEARALLLTLRWRARSVARFSKRFLHLLTAKWH